MRLIEAHLKLIEAHLRLIGAHMRLIEAHLRLIEAHLRLIGAHLRLIGSPEVDRVDRGSPIVDRDQFKYICSLGHKYSVYYLPYLLIYSFEISDQQKKNKFLKDHSNVCFPMV